MNALSPHTRERVSGLVHDHPTARSLAGYLTGSIHRDRLRSRGAAVTGVGPPCASCRDRPILGLPSRAEVASGASELGHPGAFAAGSSETRAGGEEPYLMKKRGFARSDMLRIRLLHYPRAYTCTLPRTRHCSPVLADAGSHGGSQADAMTSARTKRMIESRYEHRPYRWKRASRDRGCEDDQVPAYERVAR